MDELSQRLLAWVNKEGYPLEFRTAATLAEAGFSIRQGEYTRGAKDRPPRELDVLGSLSLSSGDHLFRILNLVECKYSEKPWACFVSSRHRIANSACVTQSEASDYGTAMLWSMAGDRDLQDLLIFSSPERPGFGGRQAFSNAKDAFFDAIRSIASNSISIASNYDDHKVSDLQLPQCCVVVFPIVVLDGRLFEVGLRDNDRETFVNEVQCVRLHWLGDGDHVGFSSIDIVTSNYFNTFCTRRYHECCLLLEKMVARHEQFLQVFDIGDLSRLEVSKGPRGIVGLPPLLARFAQGRSRTRESR